MDTSTSPLPDVMQVCRNGHVITALLHSCPDRGVSHCDRCGAGTVDRCLTCGQQLVGAVPVPGLVPVGALRPPQFCSLCGAAFPWSAHAPAAALEPVAILQTLLRRVPLVIRQLRQRHGSRPPFGVADEHDLEDLVRALLPLHFDDVRPETRTPSYASATRTDFLVGDVALVIKRTAAGIRAAQLTAQWPEDVAYYERHRTCRTLLGVVYDAESLLVETPALEKMWSASPGGLAVQCVIAR